MPWCQAEVEQGGDVHRLQQANGVEGKVFAITEFPQMLFTPGEQLLRHPLTVGKTGQVASAVSQLRVRRSRLFL
jgi:hypothetical protein